MAKKHGSSIKDDERFGLVPDNDQKNPESSSTSPGDDATTDVDDQFRAILEGLRTTLPGVQVLFAFLLTLPLQRPSTALIVWSWFFIPLVTFQRT